MIGERPKPSSPPPPREGRDDDDESIETLAGGTGAPGRQRRPSRRLRVPNDAVPRSPSNRPPPPSVPPAAVEAHYVNGGERAGGDGDSVELSIDGDGEIVLTERDTTPPSGGPEAVATDESATAVIVRQV